MTAFLDLQGFRQAARAGVPDARLYCLADHSGMPGLRRELDRAHVGWTSLFEGSGEAGAIDVAPLLFSLDEAFESGRANLIRWIAEHATYTSSLLMLAAPLDLRELAARLARRLDASLPDQIDVMLRYYDPRVFEALALVLDDAQKDAFLGTADCWWWVDRGGAVHTLQACCHAADSFTPPLRLDARQERALVAASEKDQVAARLAELVPEPYGSLPFPQRHVFISAQVDAAHALGMTSLHDLALYCAAALLDGPQFATTPKWHEVIEGVRAGRIRFSDAIDEIGA